MALPSTSVWSGIAIFAILFIFMVAIIVYCAKRNKPPRRISTVPENSHMPIQVRQQPEQFLQPLCPIRRHLRNPHTMPNPYRQPTQQSTYYHTTPYAHQTPQPSHPYPPHRVLFPSQPLQTYFPPASQQQSSTANEDHSLRPGLSDTISLDELNTFDAKGEDRHSPCPICLDPLEEEPVSTGNCLHLAHTSCLKSWLVKDSKFACPVCRVPFTDTSHQDLAVTVAAPG